MTRILFLSLIVSCLTGCAPGKPVIGSLVTREGRISDSSTVYEFHGPKNTDRVKKIFTDMYFAGDTVCFSLNGMSGVNPGEAKVVYTHIPSGITMEAERIERTGSRLWGFALVGSLLDVFYHEHLTETGWRDMGKDIPLRLTISIPGKGIKAERDFTIRVIY